MYPVQTDRNLSLTLIRMSVQTLLQPAAATIFCYYVCTFRCQTTRMFL